jgi:hypothetical protein
MTVDLIEKFVHVKIKKSAPVTIHFKDRPTVNGYFIRAADFDELKSKNFWRVVSHKHAGVWKSSKDENLSRLFNGASFTRLSDMDEKTG